MPKKRHKPEEIVAKVRELSPNLGDGRASQAIDDALTRSLRTVSQSCPISTTPVFLRDWHHD